MGEKTIQLEAYNVLTIIVGPVGDTCWKLFLTCAEMTCAWRERRLCSLIKRKFGISFG